MKSDIKEFQQNLEKLIHKKNELRNEEIDQFLDAFNNLNDNQILYTLRNLSNDKIDLLSGTTAILIDRHKSVIGTFFSYIAVVVSVTTIILSLFDGFTGYRVFLFSGFLAAILFSLNLDERTRKKRHVLIFLNRLIDTELSRRKN